METRVHQHSVPLPLFQEKLKTAGRAQVDFILFIFVLIDTHTYKLFLFWKMNNLSHRGRDGAVSLQTANVLNFIQGASAEAQRCRKDPQFLHLDTKVVKVSKQQTSHLPAEELSE